MSTLVILDMQIKPGSLDDMKATLKAILPDTRAFDGCNGLTVHTDEQDPNHMIFVEQWDSGDHYRKYLAWRTEPGNRDIVEMLVSPPDIRYFDQVDV